MFPLEPRLPYSPQCKTHLCFETLPHPHPQKLRLDFHATSPSPRKRNHEKDTPLLMQLTGQKVRQTRSTFSRHVFGVAVKVLMLHCAHLNSFGSMQRYALLRNDEFSSRTNKGLSGHFRGARVGRSCVKESTGRLCRTSESFPLFPYLCSRFAEHGSCCSENVLLVRISPTALQKFFFKGGGPISFDAFCVLTAQSTTPPQCSDFATRKEVRFLRHTQNYMYLQMDCLFLSEV